ncbi:MAG TPA: glycosyltransferase [Gammaproteobacteria bacterium]|nr:glycosyltransferase [Gammaproteobacteria bacterium]
MAPRAFDFPKLAIEKHNVPIDNHPPCMPDVGITAIVPDEWGGPWESRHQVLIRLAKYFNVVWVNPVGWWNEAWFGPRSDRFLSAKSQDLPCGFSVFEKSYYFPSFGKPWIDYASEYIRLAVARKTLRARGSRTHVLYVWRDSFFSAMDRGRYDVSCYHIDDEYTFSAVDLPIRPREENLIKRVDQVFISSPALMAKKGHLNAQTARIPNGVSIQEYITPKDEPEDMVDIPHPRIGYVGIIKRQLNIDVLLEIAKRHPEYSFVFVGPKRSDLRDDGAKWEKLESLSNAYFVGGKPVFELPAYTQHMDVCMLCYSINDYTKYIYPLKLHEYLAAGKPIVGAPLESLQEFPEYIHFAETADEWAAGIQQALSDSSQSREMVNARKNIAREHDWDVLVSRIAFKICENLGPDYVARLSKEEKKLG